jgi:hypothetical protein
MCGFRTSDNEVGEVENAPELDLNDVLPNLNGIFTQRAL